MFTISSCPTSTRASGLCATSGTGRSNTLFMPCLQELPASKYCGQDTTFNEPCPDSRRVSNTGRGTQPARCGSGARVDGPRLVHSVLSDDALTSRANTAPILLEPRTHSARLHPLRQPPLPQSARDQGSVGAG